MYYVSITNPYILIDLSCALLNKLTFFNLVSFSQTLNIIGKDFENYYSLSNVVKFRDGFELEFSGSSEPEL